MTPLVLATGRDVERMKRTRRELFDVLMKDLPQARDLTGKEAPTPAEIGAALDKMLEDEAKWPVYRNDIYQVAVREADVHADNFPPMWCLSIRRIDRAAIRDWRDFQAIKNQLIGPEHDGFEIYPAESRLVDTANQYWLFVFKDANIRTPVGFMTRSVTDECPSTGKQRPRK